MRRCGLFSQRVLLLAHHQHSIAVSGIVWPPGSANGQVYGITNGGHVRAVGISETTSATGSGNFSPTNNTLIITSRLDNVQSLLP